MKFNKIAMLGFTEASLTPDTWDAIASHCDVLSKNSGGGQT